jgi:hypothetical protein
VERLDIDQRHDAEGEAVGLDLGRIDHAVTTQRRVITLLLEDRR